MANLRKNIGRKRLLKKRENVLRRKETSTTTESALKNVTVRAGQKIGLKETIESVKALRKEQNILNSKPTSVYHRYGKNSVKRIKVTE